MLIGTLTSIVLLVAALLWGGRLHEPGDTLRRSILSFSAGAAVAYIFVHLSPELEMAKSVFVEETAGLRLWPFASYSIHVATMIGFVVFYGLEQFVADTRKNIGVSESDEHPGGMSYRIHMGVFSLYAFLVGYLLVDNLEGASVPIAFYTLAMGLHFLTVAHGLHKEYGALYDRAGARFLAASAIAGWGIATLWDFSKPMVALLLGFVAGGVIANTLISELPAEKEGRFFPFLAGSFCYTVLLLFSV